MKNFVKKLSAIALCTVFASMQVSAATVNTGDIGIGNQHGGSDIRATYGGYAGTEVNGNTADVNFTGDAHVIWNNFNVGAGETVNFNAINGASGLTVVNSVTGGMSQVYGTINSNSGISKLIISNPNGMLFDGARFTTAGDLVLHTGSIGVGRVNEQIKYLYYTSPARSAITIKDSNFNVGGEFHMVAPSIDVVKTAITVGNGMKLFTKDGQNYIVNSSTDNDHSAVRLESVCVDGNVYILSGEDLVKVVNGGTIKGDLTIESDGNVALNYVNNGNDFNVTGDVNVANDGRISYLRNANVDGNVNMSNSGGFLEIANVDVGGNVDLKTTVKTNEAVKHFIHVVGNNDIKGDLNIDSAHNIHIGGYDYALENMADGELRVGGDLNAVAQDGSIAVTIDTHADKVNLESKTLNVITDGKAVIYANDYKFKAKHYVGGVADKDTIIYTMENYKPIDVSNQTAYLITDGYKITQVEADTAKIKSHGDMDINGVNANNVYLTSTSDITIRDDVHADQITVDGETIGLRVQNAGRDYTLNYTNIRDSKVVTIDGNTEITYDMTNGENGYNKGTHTNQNTWLYGPGKPVTPPPVGPDEPTPVPPVTPTPDPEDPNQIDDAEKILKNLNRDQIASAIDAQQVYTPVAFAADLDDEIDTGVRKNVDGSVTVVRPYTPNK